MPTDRSIRTPDGDTHGDRERTWSIKRTFPSGGYFHYHVHGTRRHALDRLNILRREHPRSTFTLERA